jgi:LmbE family N-acetylglucosaminyl deacetylase
MTVRSDHETQLLLDVGRRRTELRAAMDALERALATPVGPGDAAAAWAGRLKDALRRLYDAVEEHVAITEGPDGLYAEVSTHSPRLANAVARLTEEHAEVLRRLEELLTLADVSDGPTYPAQARKAGTELHGVLMRHRQRGADLVFEAFGLDIGGEN